MSNTCAANPSATKQIPSKQQSTCPSASPSCLCVLEFLVFLFLVFLVFLVMVDFLVFHVFLLVLFLRTSWLYPTFRSIRARQHIMHWASHFTREPGPAALHHPARTLDKATESTSPTEATCIALPSICVDGVVGICWRRPLAARRYG